MSTRPQSGAALRAFLVGITSNPISLLGTAVTTASALPIITLFAIELLGYLRNPYVGILAYLILPAIFLFGLALIPLGIARERRRARRAGEAGPPPGFPVVDLNRERTRRWVLITLVLTAANLVILAVATYRGVEVMESAQFCGATCHRVMEPEYTRYARSPHAHVPCVACHIGSGADWFLKSKLAGVRQVVAVATGSYARPIPTPVQDLRPASETCGHCHSEARSAGDVLKVVTRHQDDEANTETKSVLVLKVGGKEGDRSHGIHWHADPAVQIRYRSDPGRKEIDVVELTQADGTVKRFATGEAKAADDPGVVWRTMDCVDCHNRAAHVYPAPEQEIDDALRAGRISGALPFIRREALRVLRQEYSSHDAARAGIAAEVAAYYRKEHPELAKGSDSLIDQAGRALGEIYATNVFPTMKVTWGTYPSFLGHGDDGGCFRCHDGLHTAEDGSSISQDCGSCHTLVAVEETEPAILAQLQP